MRVLIMPKQALEMLKLNHHNRPVSKPTVVKYANELKMGKWVYNGESIKIAKDGRILDGQHRLLAIIKSGRSMDTEILYDLADDIFDTIDVGRGRSHSDIFALNGVPYYSRKAASASAVVSLLRKHTQINGGHKLSKGDLYEFYESNKDIFETEGVFNTRTGNSPIGIPKKLTDSCMLYLLYFNEPELVISFFNQLQSGRIESGFEQLYKLRDYFIRQNSLTKTTATTQDKYAMTLITFANVKRGFNPKRVHWNAKGFPYDVNHKTTVYPYTS